MRKSVLESIQNRTCDALSARLTMQEALAVSIAAAVPRERGDIFGMLLDFSKWEVAVKHADTIAPTDSEWDVLFGQTLCEINQSAIESVAKETQFESCTQSIENALRCTLMEKKARDSWSNIAVKASCYVALHSEDAEARMASCMGGIVRADSRRLDDIRCMVEDEGGDILVLTKVAIALGKAIT